MNLSEELQSIIEKTPTWRPHIELDRKLATEICKTLQLSNTQAELYEIADRVLTPIEYRIWRTLYEASTIVQPHQLVSATSTSNVKSLWVHIRRLRDKLSVRTVLGQIDTVRGKGYTLVKYTG